VFAMYNTLTDGNEVHPTAIFSDQATYQYYNQSLVKNERIVMNSTAQTLNMPTLIYGPSGIPWYWDRQCPTGTMYLINNTDAKFVVDPRWYLTWGPPKSWPDQEAMVRILKLRLMLTYTRRMFLGVINGITA